MPSIVDRFNEFRGTRPAEAISAMILLGLGLFNVFFESGTVALGIGVLFTVLGLYMASKFLVKASIVQSRSS